MALGHSPSTVLDGLVFHLDAGNSRCYSGTGLTAFGFAGGIDGTLVNGVGFSSANAGSFFFDGTNDYINIPRNNLVYGTGPSTLTSWAKLNVNTNDVQIIVSYGGPSVANILLLFVNVLTTAIGGGGAQNIQAGTVSVNSWFNLCSVYDGTTAYLYLNGSLISSAARSWNITNVGYDCSIGKQMNPNQAYFNGNISDVRLYNRALTQQEILQNYNATKGRYGL